VIVRLCVRGQCEDEIMVYMRVAVSGMYAKGGLGGHVPDANFFPSSSDPSAWNGAASDSYYILM